VPVMAEDVSKAEFQSQHSNVKPSHMAPDAPVTGTADLKLVMDEFIGQLNNALNFHQLIDTFISNVRKTLPCDGIEYEEESISLYFVDGNLMQQSCHYNLSYEAQQLGHIRFTRERAFTEDELVMIETMLAGLSLPLRNALRYQQALRVAQRDELTGLRNGSYYHDSVELEIERSHRYHIPFSLIMIDLDNFKRLNDKYSREAGDAILVQIARRIEKQARSCDIVFRNGGDEFLVFLPNTARDEAVMVAERIKRINLQQPYEYKDRRITLTLSAGVVTVSQQDDAYRLIGRVDKALFHAKILGKDRVHAEVAPENVQREWR
jgi:diguanylate cyclase (GGDEF)-like protein